MSHYIFELAESKTGDYIGELTKAKGRKLTTALNAAGSLEFTLPLKDDLSMLVQEASTCVRVKRRLDSGEHEREWEGPVWKIDEETPNGLTIGCVGWLQALEKRCTKPVGDNPWGWDTLQYVDWDAGAIALDLLRQTNEDFSYSDGNFVVPGDYEPSQQRTETYQPWVSVLGAIKDLSELEAGFDFCVDPTTHELMIYEKIRRILPGVVFEYDGNVVKARRSSDVERLCNRCIAYSSIGYAVAEDLDSQRELGLFEDPISLTGVTDVAILQAYADAEVAVRSRPLRLGDFDPRRSSSAYPDDPQPLRDFRPGDVVFEHVHCGRMQIDMQAHRIFSMTTSWDDNSGATQVSNLQTTASGA